MRWQDVSNLNAKWDAAWLSGLGGGVFDGGSVLQPRAVGATDVPGGNTFWWNIQQNVNDQLDQLGRELVEVTEKPDVTTCAALEWLWLKGNMPEDAYFKTFLDDPANGTLVKQGCAAATDGVQTLPVPAPAGGSAPAPAPTAHPSAAPCQDGACDCYVNEGDEGPHIEFLQQQLNQALDAAGFERIPVTGKYDDPTCGAVFQLGGSFEPEYPTLCNNVEGEWIVPLKCPNMVLPKKKGSSKASMFAVGGLVLAAALGGAYWVSQR